MRRLIPLALGLWLVVPGARSDDWTQGLESYGGGNYSAALAAWRRAAASGNLDALNAIADAYRQGVGLSADPQRPAALYRGAAERGNVVAQLNLGDMMSRGVGVGSETPARSRADHDPRGRSPSVTGVFAVGSRIPNDRGAPPTG